MENGKKKMKWRKRSDRAQSTRKGRSSEEERKQQKKRKEGKRKKKTATTNDHTIMNLHRFSSISTHYILMQWILCVRTTHNDVESASRDRRDRTSSYETSFESRYAFHHVDALC